MATLSDATDERDRIMRTYLGVTALVKDARFEKFEPDPNDYRVKIHDTRPSELKTSDQRLIGGGWSPALYQPSVLQTIYP